MRLLWQRHGASGSGVPEDGIEAIATGLAGTDLSDFFARYVLDSHVYVHLVEWGTPVVFGGMTINPGDLIHADLHGAMTIPHEIAHEIAAATAEVERKERIVIAACQSPDFSLEKLDAAYAEMRAY